MTKIYSDTSPWGGAVDPTEEIVNEATPGVIESSSTTGYSAYRDGQAVFVGDNGIVETHPLASEWGRIIGTLSNQLDLIAALSGKVDALTGAKSSAVDAGTANQVSITDDWLYWCVQTGTAGNAKWKRIPLMNT